MLQTTLRLKKLTIIDNMVAEEGYRKLARTLQETHCGELMLKSCNLNKKKLAMLAEEWQTEENACVWRIVKFPSLHSCCE